MILILIKRRVGACLIVETQDIPFKLFKVGTVANVRVRKGGSEMTPCPWWRTLSSNHDIFLAQRLL